MHLHNLLLLIFTITSTCFNMSYSSPSLHHSFLKIFVTSILLFSGSALAFGHQSIPTIRTHSFELGAKKPIRTNIGGKKATKKVTDNKKSPAKSVATKSVFDRPKLSNDTKWSTILVAFLNPLRNPNSLFLYLLVIVSVLGKFNENNVGN